MFRGLAPRLQYAIPILTMQRPLPNFLACRAFLLLEESHHVAHTDGSTDTALHALRCLAPGGSGGNNTTGGANGNNRNNTGGGGQYRGKGKFPASNSAGGGSSYGGDSSSSSPSTRPPASPTPSSAPWTGMVHAWAMPCRPHAPGTGILGARPGAPPPFAGAAFHYQGVPPYGATAAYGAPAAPTPAPAWDQTALINALNNMSVQQPAYPPPAGGEWYLDTGATAHMASS
jgi:hypothetical protein